MLTIIYNGTGKLMHSSSNTRANSIVKRTFDLAFALALSLPALTACLLCAMVVWIECRANPFFVQVRVGKHARPFRLIKIRTMLPSTSDLPTHEVGTVAVLRSGRFLRASKLDELPQLWNVITGAMSFVGPRPCLQRQTELINARQELGVLDIRPGITGPAQLAGIDMSTPRKLAEADARYLAQASIKTDLRILLRTLLGAGSGDRINTQGAG